MKSKYLLFFLFFYCFHPLFSQLSHRNLIIEGNVSSQLFLVDGNSDLLIIANPMLSYFISDKFVVGGGIQFTSFSDFGTGFGLNGTARYYFSNQANNAWFAASNLGFLTGNNLSTFAGDIGLGLDLFLSPNIAWENTLSIGFQREEGILNNAVVFQLGTGLKFFFDRKPLGSEAGRNGILQKGNLFLGMTAGNIFLFSQNGNQNSTIILNPNMGKFLSNNWVLGGNLMIQNQSFGESNLFTLEILPYLRYYPNASRKKRAILFGEVGIGFQLNTITGDFFINQTETNPTFSGGIGVNYFLRPTVAFEIKGNYRYFKQSPFFSTNMLGLNFGFQFFFRKEAT